MTEIIFLYSLKSAFVLMLLYIPYLLMLRKECFYRTNRIVLLLILLLSIILPLLNVKTLALDNILAVEVVRMEIIEIGIPLHLSSTDSEITEHGKIASMQVSWFFMLSIISLIGSIAMLIYYTFQLWRIRQAINKGSLWHQHEEGVHIYCHANEVPAFSWMNYIVISAKEFSENGKEILLHEKGHVRAKHSWDLLFLSLVKAMQWWNPLIYVLEISLRDVHEFEADSFVLENGVSARAYQLLLIKKVVSCNSYSFTNNFNNSLTKKRISMMQKQNLNPWMRSKVLYIIPLATLALSAFATSNKSVTVTPETATISSKVTTIQIPSQNEDSTKPAVPQNYVSNPAVKAQFKGGEKAVCIYLHKNIDYPKKALEYSVEGRLTIEMYVTDKGEITNVTPVSFNNIEGAEQLAQRVATNYAAEMKAKGKELTSEEYANYLAGVESLITETVKHIKAMPKWEPAYVDKKKTTPCTSRFRLPVMFKLQTSKPSK